jgi:hypothetical protein
VCKVAADAAGPVPVSASPRHQLTCWRPEARANQRREEINACGVRQVVEIRDVMLVEKCPEMGAREALGPSTDTPKNLVRDEGVAGSNPATPTIFLSLNSETLRGLIWGTKLHVAVCSNFHIPQFFTPHPISIPRPAPRCVRVAPGWV